MDQPLITIHRPVRDGNRWIARADVSARGERVELQATASDKLANRARGWYNRAASWLGQFVRYEGGHEPRIQAAPGAGVFADLPQISYELAQKSIPYDEDVEAAAQLLHAAAVGDVGAAQQIDVAARAAQAGDELAIEALETIELLRVAATRSPEFPIASVLLAAGTGDPSARKVLAAMHATTPAIAPTRLHWDVDEYLEEPSALCSDISCACADEISARLIEPAASFGQVRHVRRRHDQPMLYTFRLIQARYGG